MTDNPVKSFDAELMQSDALTNDDRIRAWYTIAGHPFFSECYVGDEPLLTLMVRKLDEHLSIPENTPDSEKLDYLYQTAVEVRNLISKVTEEDVQKARSTLRNPLIRKALGL